MSGMDALKETMKKMGASGQLAESRAVPMVVTILANKENHLTAWKLFEEMVNNVRAQQASNTNRAQSLAFEEERINRKRREIEKREKAIADKEAEIAHIKEEILKCETQEARDRYRLAMIYDSLIDTENVYQETERIKGLAAILSGSKENADEGHQ